MSAQTAAPPLKTGDRAFRLIGVAIIFVTFVLFGGWAAFAPLESAALAPGVVKVKNYRKTVQHLEGGLVREIRIREGQFVTAGEPLIALDATQLEAERDVLRSQYISLRALESRLVSERDALETVIYPEDLLAMDPARVADATASQNQVFSARRSARDGERAVLQQRIQQLQSQVAGLRAVRESNGQLLESYEGEMSELQVLLEKGFTGKQRLTELQREHARLLGENAESAAAIAANEIRIGETRLQIIQLDRVARTRVVDELDAAQARLFDIHERLQAVQDKVSRTVIRAPVDGVVLGLNVHTVGGVVQAGIPLLDIVPRDQSLVVDAEVSPMDIDRVREGVPAKIRFSAFRSATTPIIEGRVGSISADRLLDQRNGRPYYLARIEVLEDPAGRGPELPLVPGMPAEVLINTGTRTLLQYLLQPAANVMARSLIED